MKQTERKHFIGFDILRIGAAFMVYLFHIYINLGFRTSFAGIDKIISVGAIWMVCFFMLSGYTLMYKYGEGHSDINIKEFYTKRIFAIYPFYIVFLFVIFLFHCSFPSSGLLLAFLIPIDLLGLQAHFPKAWSYLGNGGTWFISVLLFLYFMFPFLLKFVQNLDKKKIYVILACYAAAIYIGAARMIMGGDFAQYYANPLFRVPEFLIGMILAKGNAERAERSRSSLKKVLSICVLCAIIYCGGILLTYDIKVGDCLLWAQNYLSYNFLAVPVFGVLIVALANLNSERLPPQICAALEFGGKLTFPFYLTQTFANRLAGKWISNAYLGIAIDGEKKFWP